MPAIPSGSGVTLGIGVDKKANRKVTSEELVETCRRADLHEGGNLWVWHPRQTSLPGIKSSMKISSLLLIITTNFVLRADLHKGLSLQKIAPAIFCNFYFFAIFNVFLVQFFCNFCFFPAHY